MIRNRFAVFATALTLAVGVSARPALAQTWTFNDVSVGYPGTAGFSQTKDGITATFSGGFTASSVIFQASTGNFLATDGSGFAFGIGFSQAVTGINFLWMITSVDPTNTITLSTFLGEDRVFSTDYLGALFSQVEGSASYSGGAFDAVVITSNATLGGIVIDDVSVSGSVSTVPEPSTYALMAAGLAALGFVSRRRRRALVA